MAATWRLVSETAANLGLPRPSYPHIRRLVRDERRRRRARAEIRDVVKEAASTIAGGRVPGFDYTLGPPPRRAGRARGGGGLCF